MDNDISFVNYLNSEKHISFIAYGVTLLHAVGIDASYDYFTNKTKKDNLNGVILIGSHPVTGRALNKDSFVSCKNCYFIDYSREKTSKAIKDRIDAFVYISKNLRNQETIFVLDEEVKYEWFLFLKKNKTDRRVIYVLYDDGGGSYAKVFWDRLHLTLNANNVSRFGMKYIKYFIKILLRVMYIRCVERILKKHGCLLDLRIFKYSKGKLERNTDISNEYISQFRIRGINQRKNGWACFENAVIINSQCLVENGITDGVIDLEIYKRVVQVLEEFKLKITIKTHPREQNPEKYLFSNKTTVFQDSTVSQETIISCCNCPPICVLSIFSSTLLNAKGLFDIPSISLAKIALKYNITSVFRKQLSDFIKQYSAILYFPDSYEDLKQLVHSICS